MPFRPNKIVDPEGNQLKQYPADNDRKIGFRVGKRLFRRPEKTKQGRKKTETEKQRENIEQNIKKKRKTKNLFRPVIIPFTEPDGKECCRPGSDHHGKREKNHYNRKGNR